MSTIPLSEIPTLTLLYKLNKLQPSVTPSAAAVSRFNDKISLIRADITKLETDAIVNAANESLLGGGGVDGAIHRAAGPELVEECETLGGCKTGSAKITNAYELPCKKVIHAVGPVYWSAKRKGLHTTHLQGCYTKSLDLAAENGCKSIAFSALSTGVYGYPSDEAAETAIQAVKGWLEEDEDRAGKIERIVFCQFMAKDEEAYEEYIPNYFVPPMRATTEGAEDEAATKATDEIEEIVAAKESEIAALASSNTETNNPAQDPKSVAAPASNAETVPDLPEVPKEEPKHADQPAVKKFKLDEAA